MTLPLRHIPILFTSFYAALAFGTLYIVNISVQDVFANPPYNFSVSKIGLIYILSGFGFLISALFGGKWADYAMAREARTKNRYDESGKLVLRPEDRMMENAWTAAIRFPISLVWYGWTAEKGVFWVVPMLANLVFGLSAPLIFGLAVTMLTEFVPANPATASQSPTSSATSSLVSAPC
ncbi:Fc.00g106340.m01.CDS01 [Cosmosporella sp. VM-42]